MRGVVWWAQRKVGGGGVLQPASFRALEVCAAAAASHASCVCVSRAVCCLCCSQIRQLESQLSQLRSQAAEIEDKRAKLHQRQSAALDALSASTGRKMPVRRYCLD